MPILGAAVLAAGLLSAYRPLPLTQVDRPVDLVKFDSDLCSLLTKEQIAPVVADGKLEPWTETSIDGLPAVVYDVFEHTDECSVSVQVTDENGRVRDRQPPTRLTRPGGLVAPLTVNPTATPSAPERLMMAQPDKEHEGATTSASAARVR